MKTPSRTCLTTVSSLSPEEPPSGSTSLKSVPDVQFEEESYLKVLKKLSPLKLLFIVDNIEMV